MECENIFPTQRPAQPVGVVVRRSGGGRSLTETIDEPSTEDQTGVSALRTLVVRLEPNAQALMELRQGGETTLWWSGDADSTQGGFVLEADLIRYLPTLGCDVFGTAFLAEEDEGARGDDDVSEFRIGIHPRARADPMVSRRLHQALRRAQEAKTILQIERKSKFTNRVDGDSEGK